MVEIIFVLFVIKGILYDVPPEYGWKIVKNSKEPTYNAYSFKEGGGPKYNCQLIEEKIEASPSSEPSPIKEIITRETTIKETVTKETLIRESQNHQDIHP